MLLASIASFSVATHDDFLPPSVTVFRNPAASIGSGTVVTITANALDNNGISSLTVFASYNGATQSRTCNNAVQCSIELPLLPQGTLVSYGATAIDASTSRNAANANPASFTVQPAASAGTLKQFVSDCRSALPITGASVSINGQTVLTGSDGYAFANNVPFGTYGVTIAASFHQTALEQARILQSGDNFYVACLAPSSNSGTPAVTLSRSPPSVVTTSNIVTLSANSFDDGTIVFTRIRFTLGSGQQQTAVCSGASCSTQIGPLAAGVVVSFFADALDNDGNAASTPPQSFTVLSSISFAPSPTPADFFPPAVSISRTPAGTVTPQDNVQLTATASDASGIAWTQLFFRVNNGFTQSVLCGGPACAANLGALPAGATVTYSAQSQDASPQQNVGSTQQFSFIVTQTTGSLSVHSFDCQSGAPLSNAIVSIGARTSSTSLNGDAFFSSLPTGSQQLSLFASGYNAATQAISVNAGANSASICASKTTGSDVTPPVVVSTRSPAGTVSSTDAVTLTATASDASGISWTQIVYSVNNGPQTAATCTAFSCSVLAGPFVAGTTISFFSQARDASANGNIAASGTQLFVVAASGGSGGSGGTNGTATASGACSILPSLQSVLSGSTVSVAIVYSNFSSSPQAAPVNCGNGVLTNAVCIATNCTAQCIFPSPGSFLSTASVLGVTCSPATILVASPSVQDASNKSTLLVRVLDARSGERLQKALVNVEGVDYETNSFGEATIRLFAGNYSVGVSKQAYNSTTRNVTLLANDFKIIQLSLDYSFSACDQLAEVVSPSCSGNQLSFQLRVENRLPTANSISVSFDSPFTISGANTIALQQNQISFQNYSATTPVDFSGNVSATARITGRNSSCASSFVIPLCVPSTISVTARERTLEAFPGKTSCTSLIVRNNAASETQVDLLASSSLYANLSANKFLLAGKTSSDVEMCVTAPSGASGNFVVTATALSPLGSGSDAVTVRVTGQSSFALNNSACLNTTATSSQLVNVDASAPNYFSKFLSALVNPITTNPAPICLLPLSSGSDSTPPTITLLRGPTGIVYAGNLVTLITVANDSSSVKSTKILYQINSGSISTTSCTTPTCSVAFNAPSGSVITYWGFADDSSPRNNGGESPKQSVNVVDAPSGQDTTAPTVSVSRTPSGTTSPTDSVSLSATASDATGVNQIIIFFKKGASDWQSVACSGTQCSFNIGSTTQGTTVLFYATARDSSPNGNTGISDVSFFIVSPSSPAGVTAGGLDVFVTDCNTNAPITGAKVTVRSSTLTTASDGVASFGRGTIGSQFECGCVPVPATGRTVIPLTLENTGKGGDYRVEARENIDGIAASLEQEGLANFGSSTARNIFLDVATDAPAAGSHRVELAVLSSDGSLAFTQNVCLLVSETYALKSYFSPNNFLVAQGSVFNTKLVLQNNGNNATAITLTGNSELARLASSRVTVQPRSSSELDLTVDTRTQAGSVENRVVEITNRGNTTIQVTPTLLGVDSFAVQSISPQLRALQPGESQNFTVTLFTGTKPGHYSVPYAVTRDRDGTVVSTATLEFDVVRPDALRRKTILQGVEIASVQPRALPETGDGFVAVTIRNNNAFQVNGIAAYATNLPFGVASQVARVEAIPPFSEKTALVPLSSSGAAPGVHSSLAKIDGEKASDQRPFLLRVGNEPLAGLNVDATVPLVTYSSSNGSRAEVTVAVTNRESAPINAIAYFTDLPKEYLQETLPQKQLIAPGETRSFTVIVSTRSQPSDFNATLSVEALGKSRKSTVPLQLLSGGAFGFTGFFTLGSSALPALFVLLLLAGGALLFAARENKKKLVGG